MTLPKYSKRLEIMIIFLYFYFWNVVSSYTIVLYSNINKNSLGIYFRVGMDKYLYPKQITSHKTYP